MNIRLHPLIGLKSFRSPEAGGAFRFWVLAKNMAGQLDHIKRDEVVNQLREFKVNEKQINRWLTAARNYDMVKDVQRKSGEWMLILSGTDKVMAVLESPNRGQAVSLDAKLLFGKTWRAYVFASWQSSFTNNGERLVSQIKQSEITGIDPQSQRKFNKQAGVRSSKNFAISNIHANGFEAVQEFGNRAAPFKYWNNETHQYYIGWRIPDSRVFSEFGTDKSNNKPKTMNLFNRTPDQYSQTMKAIRKQDVTQKEVYVYDRQSKAGNSLWIHLPF